MHQGGRYTFPNATADVIAANLRVYLRGKTNVPRMWEARLVDRPGHPEEGLLTLFENYDIDRDGYVGFEDIKTVMGPGRDDVAIEAAVDRYDVDGDGRLTYSDFVLMYISGRLETAPYPQA